MYDTTMIVPDLPAPPKHEGEAEGSSLEGGLRLLDAIFSSGARPGASPPIIEFRYLKEGAEVIREFKSLPDLRLYLEDKALHARNHDGYNVYFGVNPRSEVGKGNQASVRDIFCLWADIDVKDTDPTAKLVARSRIDAFPLVPSAIVDSGHGFHLYWILRQPIIDRSEEQTLQVKGILRGLVTQLAADPQATDFSRLLRLPGTTNVKDPDNPVGCELLQFHGDRLYSLADFEPFRLLGPEPERVEVQLLDFPTKRLFVRSDSLEHATSDVGDIEVSPYIRRMILVGDTSLKVLGDKTQSGRDQTILTALVSSGYDLETATSIFTNEYLGCSQRMIKKGLGQLKYEYEKALKFLKKHEGASPERQHILVIRQSPLPAVEKAREIREYIKRDLFGDKVDSAAGFKDGSSHYYFDASRKLLLDVDKDDFKWFLRTKYGLSERDLRELLEELKAIIWKHGIETRVHLFAHFDAAAHVLYISTNRNQVIRLDGHKISLVDNGTDGILFRTIDDWAPIISDPEILSGLDYFSGGFDWNKFEGGGSLLYRHLIARANFTGDRDVQGLPDSQRYLLTLYFYSLFFESVMLDKPILCFEGVKASGKSYIGSAVGSILFGEEFQPTSMPEQLRDLAVALSQNYFIVLDNVDSRVPGSHLNMLCQAATGGGVSLRQLYTDHTEIKARLQGFVAITTRHPKFKRDDLVDRLIIFNTEKIKEPIGRSVLFKELNADRDKLWDEMLINLNSIVRLLRSKADWNPPSSMRIADWDLFCKKVHSARSLETYSGIVRVVTARKDRFSLKDDPFYETLRDVVYDRGQSLVRLSAKDLYDQLHEAAKKSGLDHSFTSLYRSPLALAHRISHVTDELGSEFDVVVSEQSHGKTKLYSFSRKPSQPTARVEALATELTVEEEGSLESGPLAAPADGCLTACPHGEPFITGTPAGFEDAGMCGCQKDA